ncbi:hypothetical protein C5C10_04535 [Rathayibacter sp. AY1A3]|nr:hypothetical protein C5C10_04535 [Rathayibacter sp. AY1A3]
MGSSRAAWSSARPIGPTSASATHATDLGRPVVRELMAAGLELGEDVLSGLSHEELETGLRTISRELCTARD